MKVEKPDLVQLASGASRFAIPAHDIKYDSRSPVSTAGHSTRSYRVSRGVPGVTGAFLLCLSEPPHLQNS